MYTDGVNNLAHYNYECLSMPTKFNFEHVRGEIYNCHMLLVIENNKKLASQLTHICRKSISTTFGITPRRTYFGKTFDISCMFLAKETLKVGKGQWFANAGIWVANELVVSVC